MKLDFKNKKVLVTGGAGFIGSRLAERLLDMEAYVTAVDSLLTGDKSNLEYMVGNQKFTFIKADIRDSIVVDLYKEQDFIFHLACPAATAVFTKIPEETLDISYNGTKMLLESVKELNIPILFTSSSEVYGKNAHNVKEDNCGSVKFTGIRAGYDEGKRIAETLISIYKRKYGMKIFIPRLFNTYGGRETTDGRLIPTLIKDAVKENKMYIFGDGKQTRTINYVDDTIDAMLLIIEKDITDPINIGGEKEMSVNKVARKISKVLGIKCKYEKRPRPEDEPIKRKPNISKLKELGYKQKYNFESGIIATYNEMKKFKII